MAGPPREKVWVEAEQDKDGKIVLSLSDVAKRRRLVASRGKHNVFLQNLSKLANFPTQYTEKLKQGYPVKFLMNEVAYETMLGEATGLAGGGDRAEMEERLRASIGEDPDTVFAVITSGGEVHGALFFDKGDAQDHVTEFKLRGAKVMTMLDAATQGINIWEWA
jgi:hypothetical protein